MDLVHQVQEKLNNISASRCFAAMGLYTSNPELVLDGCLLDNGTNTNSIIGERLLDAAIPASVNWTSLQKLSNSRSIRCLGGANSSPIATLMFYFIFVGKLCDLRLHIVSGEDLMLMSHKDMDRLELN